MLSVFHRKGAHEIVAKFLADFQRIVDKHKSASLQTQKLIELNQLCKREFKEASQINEDATTLLLGVSEGYSDSTLLISKHLNSDIIAIEPNRLITCTVDRLLNFKDPKVQLYNDGRDLFNLALTKNKADMLSGTSLEYAYIWVLACDSALGGDIQFNEEVSFPIKCKRLVKGSLFQGGNTALNKEFVQQMENNIMYYANEPREHETDAETKQRDEEKRHSHPVYFLTEDDELVLVDVTGGDINAVKDKLKEMASWLEVNGDGGNKIKLQNGKFVQEIRCIVLAPNVHGAVDVNIGEGVDLVSGYDAIRLLKGMGQILPWLVEGYQPDH
jgi:hypothetical protein